MKSKLETELAIAALADTKGGVDLLTRGFVTIHQMRSDDAVQNALKMRSARSAYVAVHLRRGATLVIHLRVNLPGPFRPGERATMPLAELRRSRGSAIPLNSAKAAAHVAAERCDNRADQMIRVVQAIERARKQILKLTEEGTRWF